jgi:hypothetical protein
MRSEDPDDYHQFRHDEAPIEVWRELITRYSLANEWVARNKTAPVEILREISSNPRVVVRTEVAMTRRITPGIQAILATDPDASVRNALANNAMVSESILEQLAEDSEEFVRDTALRRLKERQCRTSRLSSHLPRREFNSSWPFQPQPTVEASPPGRCGRPSTANETPLTRRTTPTKLLQYALTRIHFLAG